MKMSNCYHRVCQIDPTELPRLSKRCVQVIRYGNPDYDENYGMSRKKKKYNGQKTKKDLIIAKNNYMVTTGFLASWVITRIYQIVAMK